MAGDRRTIGLAGTGHWGKNVLRNLHDLGALHTACDIDPGALPSYENLGGTVTLTSSFDDLLADPTIKAVCIATPAATHYALAGRALTAGKDVFVEKPLALTSREGRELVDLARRKGRILMVGHVMHYHPAVEKMKDLVDSGSVGKLRYVYSNRLNMGRLRAEENILWSFAPHDISLILGLIGKMPDDVSSFGGAYINRDLYDTTLTSLTFPGGVKGHIFVSWLHPYKEQKLIIVGSKGMAVFDDQNAEKLLFYPHHVKWENGIMPVAQKKEFQVLPVENKEPLQKEIEHFIDCIVHRRPPLTDGEEALRVLEVLEAAERSLNRGVNPPALVYGGKEDSYFVHESSYIDENVKIGDGTRVWHFSHILHDTVVGAGCTIGQNVAIGPHVQIGDRCKIQNNVSVFKGVTLEDEVFCGPSCVFTNIYNPRAFIERKGEFEATVVRRGATIGANATIICGVSVGEYAMIGAGAVVKDDVPGHAVMAGVPARRIGWACRCGTTLSFQDSRGACPSCGMKYRSGTGDSIRALTGSP